MHLFLKFMFGIKFYMFRTVLLSIIRSFSVRTQQRNVLILLASSVQNLYDIYHCCACSEKLVMMDRGTVRNM